jgi:hypothetical protein
MEDARPLENLVFDSTIMLDSADRPWAGHLVAQLHFAAKAKSNIDLCPSFLLGLFVQHLRHAAVVAGVLEVPHHPHAARHGGASTNALTGARTLAQIQQWETWRCFRSVIRYGSTVPCRGRLLSFRHFNTREDSEPFDNDYYADGIFAIQNRNCSRRRMTTNIIPESVA